MLNGKDMWLFLFDLDDTLIEDTAGPDGKIVKWGKHCTPIAGALDTIKQLKEQGYHVAIYSMGSHTSRLERLAAAGLDQSLFLDVYAATRKDLIDWKDLEKTDLNAFRKLGMKIMYIGDSWHRDAGVGLGRADAVVFIKTEESMKKWATPDNLDEYPVWPVGSVAELPALLPQIIADPYRGKQKDEWIGYYDEAQKIKAKQRAEKYPTTTPVGAGSSGGSQSAYSWGGTYSAKPRAIEIPSDPGYKIPELPAFPGGNRACVRIALKAIGDDLNPVVAMEKTVELFESLGFTLYERQPVLLDMRLLTRKAYDLSVFWSIPVPDDMDKQYLRDVLLKCTDWKAFKAIRSACESFQVGGSDKARTMLAPEAMPAQTLFSFPAPSVDKFQFEDPGAGWMYTVPAEFKVPGSWKAPKEAIEATLKFMGDLGIPLAEKNRWALLWGGIEAGFKLRLTIAVPVGSGDPKTDPHAKHAGEELRKLVKLLQEYKFELLWEKAACTNTKTGESAKKDDAGAGVSHKWDRNLVDFVVPEFTRGELLTELSKASDQNGRPLADDYMVHPRNPGCKLFVPASKQEFYNALLNDLRKNKATAVVKEKSVPIDVNDFPYARIDSALAKAGYKYGLDYSLGYGSSLLLTLSVAHSRWLEFKTLVEDLRGAMYESAASLTDLGAEDVDIDAPVDDYEVGGVDCEFDVSDLSTGDITRAFAKIGLMPVLHYTFIALSRTDTLLKVEVAFQNEADTVLSQLRENKRSGIKGLLDKGLSFVKDTVGVVLKAKDDEAANVKWETITLPDVTDLKPLKKAFDKYGLQENRDYYLALGTNVARVKAPAKHMWAYKRLTGVSQKGFFRYTASYMVGQQRLDELLQGELKGHHTLVVVTGKHHQSHIDLHSIWIPAEAVDANGQLQ